MTKYQHFYRQDRDGLWDHLFSTDGGQTYRQMGIVNPAQIISRMKTKRHEVKLRGIFSGDDLTTDDVVKVAAFFDNLPRQFPKA